MKYYADSSFLVSCYLMDANTTKAKDWLLRTNVPLPFTDLHALEVSNAQRLGVFRRFISQSEADAAITDIENDLTSALLVKRPVDWRAAFRMAARLSENHSATSGSRSLDIHAANRRLFGVSASSKRSITGRSCCALHWTRRCSAWTTEKFAMIATSNSSRRAA
jgi:predicted nucleic acid-binding protein